MACALRRLDRETRRRLAPSVCDDLGDTPTYEEVAARLRPSHSNWLAWLDERLACPDNCASCTRYIAR